MTLTETTTLAEIATQRPSSVRLFQKYGMDFCCGGKRAIGAVCKEHGLSFAEFVSGLEQSEVAGSAPQPRDWTLAPLHDLMGHIVITYHDALREELPRLERLASKVADVHGEKAPQLKRLKHVLGELAADLVDHMRKEELVLFPAIRAVENGLHERAWVSTPIAVMEDEHEHAGELLAELRRITQGYVAPEWACGTLRALYDGLSELEAAMHVHVHLENNVLFPRVLELLDT